MPYCFQQIKEWKRFKLNKNEDFSSAWFFIFSFALLFILFDDSFVPDYAPPGPSFSFFSRSLFHTIFQTIQTTFFLFGCRYYTYSKKNLLSAVQMGRWGISYILQKLRSIVFVQFIIFLSSRLPSSFMNKTKGIRNW